MMNKVKRKGRVHGSGDPGSGGGKSNPDVTPGLWLIDAVLHELFSLSLARKEVDQR